MPFNSCNFRVFRVFPFWLSSCLHISHSCVYLSECCQREQPKCLAECGERGEISTHARGLIKYFSRNENENIFWSIHAKLNIILMCVLCFPAHLSRWRALFNSILTRTFVTVPVPIPHHICFCHPLLLLLLLCVVYLAASQRNIFHSLEQVGNHIKGFSFESPLAT